MKEKNKDKNLIQITDMLESIIRRHELVRKMKYGGKFERWEDFGLHVLNVIYDWNLVDLNDKYQTNFPGIDLGNDEGIGVQVTIDNTTKHINDSIQKYEDGYFINDENILPSKYPKLMFLFISTNHSITKEYSYSIENNGFEFVNKNIITFSTLLSKIESLAPAKIIQIKDVLEGFVSEFDDYLRNQLRNNKYELAKEVLKENVDEFRRDPVFQEVLKEVFVISNKAVGVSAFTYDFDKFSESYSFILKNIERIRKKDLTKSEIVKFYKSVSENSSYIIHFFDNIGEVEPEILDEIIDKLIYPIIQNNKTYQNFISIISYLGLYITTNKIDDVLKIFYKILEVAEDEFVFRKISIILSNNKLSNFDTSLMIALVSIIVDRGRRLAHDFIVEFLSKNIDKFSSYEIETLMNIFDFDGTGSDNLISINSSIREERYFPDIFSKIFFIDYKLTFKFFGKLLKLFYENDKYSITKRTLTKINGINHIGYYSFPEVTLSTRRRRNDLQENIFISIGNSLIKAGQDSKNRDFFIEVIKYIIENGDYSVFFEIVSFALVDEKEKNIDLIRDLVHKKEILPFINIFQQRWGIEIFTYLFSKEDDYIEEFEKYVIENEELKSHEYHQIYLLSTIPKSKLSKRGEQFISSFLSEHKGYKITFRTKPSFEVTTWAGRQEPLAVKLEKREKLEDIYKKSDLVLEKDKGWDLYDYKGIFEEYFKNNLDQIKDVYSYIAGKGEEAYILASMPIRGFLEYSKEKYKDTIDISFYKELVDIYSVIKDNDRHSKLEVGRLLDDNEFLRREFTSDISKIDKAIYEGIKSIVLDLASNKEPDKDSENDGLTLGLNTVRGLGTIITPILLHYYPSDDDLKNKIIELSNDKLYGIQSTLVANIPLLLKGNKELLRSILSKYLYTRNKIIDQSLVNYCIDRLGYVENKDLYVGLLNGLLKSDDKDIQNKTGELLGYVILSGLQNQNEDSIKEYRAILDDIIFKKNGTHESMLGFGFAIQNNIISIPEVLEKKIELITYILDNYEEPSGDEYSSLTYRLSFLFYKDNFLPEYFDIFYEKEVFQKLISKSKSLESFGNINEFLKDILESRGLEVVDRIKKLMKLQVDTNKGLFHAHSFTHLEDLLTILYDKYDGKNCKICNMIFEKGLEIGHKAYIKIYEKYYKNEE